jgi:hypothetical protein
VWEIVPRGWSRTEKCKADINDSTNETEEINMLWTIFVVILILWLLGFSLHIAGGLIHLLLVVALVVLVINLVSGRSAV